MREGAGEEGSSARCTVGGSTYRLQCHDASACDLPCVQFCVQLSCCYGGGGGGDGQARTRAVVGGTASWWLIGVFEEAFI